jgi:hypothetical protein
LDARGYRYAEQDPDLIVNFRVFDEPTEVRTVEDIGPGFWAQDEFRGAGIRTASPGAMPAWDGIRVRQLEAGSIFVQIADMGTGQVVWQGFASGLTDGNVFSKEEERVNEAVSKIFDQYPHEARELSEMQERR